MQSFFWCIAGTQHVPTVFWYVGFNKCSNIWCSNSLSTIHQKIRPSTKKLTSSWPGKILLEGKILVQLRKGINRIRAVSIADLYCHQFLITVATAKGNPDQGHQSMMCCGCIAVTDSNCGNSGTPKSASVLPPCHPTRNNACLVLKKSTEGTDASFDFVPSPLHLPGRRATRGRKLICYNALVDQSHIPTPAAAAAPAVAGHASKGTSPQEYSGGESEGGDMGGHLVLTSRKKMHLLFLRMILIVI